MAIVYQRGSRGNEVRKIQTRLNEVGVYRGPIDGDYGGGTESAVRLFQKGRTMEATGVTDEKTWAALFPQEKLPPPAIYQKPLAVRCLALTGSIETSKPVPDCFAGLSGDFDGQGISFGACQWNLGQKSLQPLLASFIKEAPQEAEAIFGDRLAELTEVLASPLAEQLAWARSIQDAKTHRLFEPWRGMLLSVGRLESFIEQQKKAASGMFGRAAKMAYEYHCWSERAVALLFDIVVQNGSIGAVTKAQIEREIAVLPQGLSKEAHEVERMKIIANRRAEAANPRWIEDVRRRKLVMAMGEGVIHGSRYDLAGQYGIRLVSVSI